MIDAELRSGNWVKNRVYFNAPPIKVTIEDIYNSTDLFEPIALTEEILLKCGFEKTSCNIVFSLTLNPDATLVVNQNDGDAYLINFGETINIGAKIKYLHTLQNFIYAFNGEELIIKL